MELVTFVVGADSKGVELACKSLWAVVSKPGHMNEMRFRVGAFDENGNLTIDNELVKKKLLPKLNLKDFEWNRGSKFGKKNLLNVANNSNFDDFDIFLNMMEGIEVSFSPSSPASSHENNQTVLIPIKKRKNKKHSSKSHISQITQSYTFVENEVSFSNTQKGGDTEWVDKDEAEFDLCSIASANDLQKKDDFKLGDESKNFDENISVATSKYDGDEWSVISMSDGKNHSLKISNPPNSFIAALMKNKTESSTPQSKPTIIQNIVPKAQKKNKGISNKNKHKSFEDDYFETTYQDSKSYLHGRKR